MKYIFGRNSSPKVICWWPRPSQILYRISPIFSVFRKLLCEVYRRFGTETSPVVSLNYLLSIGKRWWRCYLCCAVSCGHLLRCSRWIWSRRSRSRGNTVCSVTSLTLRYIVGKIGRLSLQLAKTARDDIINSIRENKLTFNSEFPFSFDAWKGTTKTLNG